MANVQRSTIVKFPKAKKRGPKTRKGPCADIIRLNRLQPDSTDDGKTTMTAKIIPFPSQNQVRRVPADAEQEYLPPAVRQLLAMMEATERAFGSNMVPKGMSDEQWRRAIAPYLQ